MVCCFMWRRSWDFACLRGDRSRFTVYPTETQVLPTSPALPFFKRSALHASPSVPASLPVPPPTAPNPSLSSPPRLHTYPIPPPRCRLLFHTAPIPPS